MKKNKKTINKKLMAVSLSILLQHNNKDAKLDKASEILKSLEEDFGGDNEKVLSYIEKKYNKLLKEFDLE